MLSNIQLVRQWDKKKITPWKKTYTVCWETQVNNLGYISAFELVVSAVNTNILLKII